MTKVSESSDVYTGASLGVASRTPEAVAALAYTAASGGFLLGYRV